MAAGPEQPTLQQLPPQAEGQVAVDQAVLVHESMSLDSLPIRPDQMGEPASTGFKDRFQNGFRAAAEVATTIAENPRVRRAALHVAVAAGRGAGLQLGVSREGSVSLTGIDQERIRQHGTGVKSIAKGVAGDALSGARSAVPAAIEELRG